MIEIIETLMHFFKKLILKPSEISMKKQYLEKDNEEEDTLIEDKDDDFMIL